jgi:hypothetical protein
MYEGAFAGISQLSTCTLVHALIYGAYVVSKLRFASLYVHALIYGALVASRLRFASSYLYALFLFLPPEDFNQDSRKVSSSVRNEAVISG